MSERWNAPPRLAGYESWVHQMPGPGSDGDILVSAPLRQADTPRGEPPSRWLIALGGSTWGFHSGNRLKTALEDEVVRLVRTVTDPASLLAALNHGVMDMEEDFFALAAIAVIDGDGHHLSVAYAGFAPLLLRRSDGRVEAIAEDACGFPLGVERGQTYETVTVPVEPGDVAFLCSDGLTDVVDDRGRDVFGRESLRRAIIRAPRGAAAVGRSVLESVRRFGGGRPPRDDITLVCLGRTA